MRFGFAVFQTMSCFVKLLTILSIGSVATCHVIRRDTFSNEDTSERLPLDVSGVLPGAGGDEANEVDDSQEEEGVTVGNDLVGTGRNIDEENGAWVNTSVEVVSDNEQVEPTAEVSTITNTSTTQHRTSTPPVDLTSITSPMSTITLADDDATTTVEIQTTTVLRKVSPTHVHTVADGGARTVEPTASGENSGDVAVCHDPPEHQLRLNFQQKNQHNKFPALAILTKEGFAYDDRNPLVSELTRPARPALRAVTEDYTNSTCPIELLQVMRGHEDLNERSLCPWSYVPDEDPDRYPTIILVAKCRCPQCINTAWTEDIGPFSNDNQCRPVMFQMKVLQRGPCVNGMYMYNAVYQEIPVACACVRPKV